MLFVDIGFFVKIESCYLYVEILLFVFNEVKF